MLWASLLFTLAVVVVHTAAQCPTGWTLYNDVTGTVPYQEGQNSCLFLDRTTVRYTAMGATVCSSLSTTQTPWTWGTPHLLTIQSTQARATNSLYNAAYALVQSAAPGAAYCVGVPGWLCVPSAFPAAASVHCKPASVWRTATPGSAFLLCTESPRSLHRRAIQLFPLLGFANDYHDAPWRHWLCLSCTQLTCHWPFHRIFRCYIFFVIATQCVRCSLLRVQQPFFYLLRHLCPRCTCCTRFCGEHASFWLLLHHRECRRKLVCCVQIPAVGTTAVAEVWVGGTLAASGSFAWKWMDSVAAAATVLNCGSNGCGLWASTKPG
jgi:hypothetical protein